MSKRECVLGIDLGTSSVKVMARYRNGETVKIREAYRGEKPECWWNAVADAMARAELTEVAAIGLSSQVGTYIIDGREVIDWSDPRGEKELERLKKRYTRDEFLREISMVHPNINSYPMPRLIYIKERYPNVRKVCQPKDFLCERLTGSCVTDKYSWRGLTNLSDGRYSQWFLNEIGFDEEKLPQLAGNERPVGYTKEIRVGEKIIPEGIPVYVGLNDFFASVLGMGARTCGDMFDITGTSEHLGILESCVRKETEMVSGPYLRDYVHYGVTASSGISLDYGRKLFPYDQVDMERCLHEKAPIFLPYLKGERAPVWDPMARGLFYGIGEGCTREHMAYAVLEGVAFSLFHIYEYMGSPRGKALRVSGGASVNPILNQIKADLFGIPVFALAEQDTSAQGACLVAAVGAGWFSDEKVAAEQSCKIREVFEPKKERKGLLERRFSIYKSLYPAVRAITKL